MVKRSAWMLLGGIVVLFGIFVISGVLAPKGDPGRLTEALVSVPPGIALPDLEDVTARWGLADWRNDGAGEFAGGATVVDLDDDGLLDLVVSGGRLTIFFNDGGSFAGIQPVIAGISSEVLSTSAADVDRDGFVDLLIGAVRGDGVIVWGGEWAARRDIAAAEVAPIPGGNRTTAVGAADLTGNGLLDVVILGYGGTRMSSDVVLLQRRPRIFDRMELPDSNRRSMALEFADLVDDAGLELYVTRDVGWEDGGDSLYVSDDGWATAADLLEGRVEIDGMGVTVGDLDADGSLDVYVSDLGDNEWLSMSGTALTSGTLPGIARIRPPGASPEIISSSWSTSLADVNLDGYLDLVIINGGFFRAGVPNKISGSSVSYDDPPAILLGLDDGSFADAWPELGIEWEGVYRGLGLGDLDADGDVDLVFVSRDGGLRAFRNNTHAPSLTVVAAPGCDPRGAAVRVEVGGRTNTRLLAPHTFLGSIASEVTIGGVGPWIITVDWADGTRSEAIAPSSAERSSLVVGCR